MTLFSLLDVGTHHVYQVYLNAQQMLCLYVHKIKHFALMEYAEIYVHSIMDVTRPFHFNALMENVLLH
jgi:hypothetical protein